VANAKPFAGAELHDYAFCIEMIEHVEPTERFAVIEGLRAATRNIAE